MNSLIHNLFPTAVGVYEVGLPTQEEINFCKNLQYEHNINNISSVCKNILFSKELKNLCNQIQIGLDNYFKLTHEADDVSIVITESWLNITNRGESHHEHHHPNSIISGVYYIETEENSDVIEFKHPSPPWYECKVLKYNAYNSLSWQISAHSGQLILFPSYLKHNVPTLSNDRKLSRVSLAFNTFIQGNLGSGQTKFLSLKVNNE